MTTLEFDYKDVDWKQVKSEWDDDPFLFYLKIKHGENKITISSFLDKSKRYRLIGYVNGRFEHGYTNKGHEFVKYQNKKFIKLGSSLIKCLDKKVQNEIKKIGERAWAEREGRVNYFFTPFFDNIAQIKKMVTALE